MSKSPNAKLPIDRPCSACSGGDYKMEHHDHAPPFRAEAAQSPEPSCCPNCLSPHKSASGVMQGLCKNEWHKSGSVGESPAPATECATCGGASDKRQCWNGHCVSKAGYHVVGTFLSCTPCFSKFHAKNAVIAAAPKEDEWPICEGCKDEFNPENAAEDYGSPDAKRFCSKKCAERVAAPPEPTTDPDYYKAQEYWHDQFIKQAAESERLENELAELQANVSTLEQALRRIEQLAKDGLAEPLTMPKKMRAIECEAFNQTMDPNGQGC